MNLGDYTGLGM